jgi:hypothetical protein
MRRALAILTVAFGAVFLPLSPGSGALAAGSTIVNDTFVTQPTDVNFNGSAQYSSTDQAGVLTDFFGQAGSIFTKSSYQLTDFTSTYQFRVFGGSSPPADGFGFVIQQVGNTAVGGGGSGMGFVGLGGYGAIYRTYSIPECNGPNARFFVAVATGSCASHSDLVTIQSYAIANLFGPQWHTAVVSVISGKMSISIDGTSYLSNITLPGYTAGQRWYIGFTGSTGGL